MGEVGAAAVGSAVATGDAAGADVELADTGAVACAAGRGAGARGSGAAAALGRMAGPGDATTSGATVGAAAGGTVGVGRGALMTGLSSSTGPCARGLGVFDGVGSEKVVSCAASGLAASAASAIHFHPIMRTATPCSIPDPKDPWPE